MGEESGKQEGSGSTVRDEHNGGKTAVAMRRS